MSKQRLIIVSNRPPISIHETGSGLAVKRAPGGLASAMSGLHEGPDSLWVGWSGMQRSLSQEEFESLELGPKLALINLESDLYHRYYDAFANGSLWPIFHGFQPRRMYDEEDFEAATTVTERFARCVAQLAGPDDIIWVHDFHLVLLPAMLRKLGLKNKIGFFLHIPFPEDRNFTRLPDHDLIARSIAQADLIGLQTQRDAERLKKYIAGQGLAVENDAVQAFPIGIDYEKFRDARELPEMRRHLDGIRAKYQDKTVIFSISRLDYTKGILHQLQAVDSLLAINPGRREFIYKLVVAPSREDLAEYQDEKLASAALAKAINQTYGDKDWQPVEFEYRNYDFDELVAWYRRADIMLVAPLIDGMNLVAKEYVAAHDDNGMLVLGKGAGAASQLTDAMLVEPREIAGMALALQACLDMPADERGRRMRAMREVVQRENVHAWANGFLNKLAQEKIQS